MNINHEDPKEIRKRIARVRSFTIPGSNRGHGSYYKEALRRASRSKSTAAAALAVRLFDDANPGHPAVK